MSFQNWLKKLSGPGLAAVGLGLIAIMFGAGGADWWLAQQIPWWAFGLLTAAVMITTSMVRAIRKVRRD